MSSAHQNTLFKKYIIIIIVIIILDTTKLEERRKENREKQAFWFIKISGYGLIIWKIPLI